MKRKTWKKYNLPKKGMISKESLYPFLLQAPDPMPFEILGNLLESVSNGQYKMVKIEKDGF